MQLKFADDDNDGIRKWSLERDNSRHAMQKYATTRSQSVGYYTFKCRPIRKKGAGNHETDQETTDLNG